MAEKPATSPHGDGNVTPSPEIAIVIPTRSRPDSLVNCLEALEKQTAESLEIVVVDDASPDPEAVARVVRRWPRARLVRREAQGGVGAARNTGARAVHAQFVCFTDDDCRPAPDWVARLVEPLRLGADAVAGATVNACVDNPFDTALQTIVNCVAEHAAEGPARTAYGPGSNLGATAELLRQVPFDERYSGAAEERDWCARIIALGHVLASEPRAVVFHHQHLDLRSFWRKNVHYGRGAYTLRRLASPSRAVGRRRFYSLLFRRGFEAGLVPGSLVLLGQVATVFGYGRELATTTRGR